MRKKLMVKAVLLLTLFSIAAKAATDTNISLETLINAGTLHQLEDSNESVYKAILRLPDLSAYTESPNYYAHFNAHYLEGETPNRTAKQLISELLQLADESNQYLLVNYSIHKNRYYQIAYGRFYRQYCANVLDETVIARFHNGLTLKSEERSQEEVPLEFCETL